MIFVTGATGFIGSHLVSALVNRGKKVVAIKRPGSAVPELLKDVGEAVEWRTADIMNIFELEESLTDCQEVYHCAGKISFSRRDQHDLFNTNMDGTANLVNLCLAKKIPKFLYVSSIAALGEMRSGLPITEHSTWEYYKGISGYAASKFAAEQEVWRGIVEGLNAVIVNPSVVLGENNWDKGSGKFFGWVKKGLSWYPGGMISLVYVRDLVECMVQLMDGHWFGERFIISAENMPYQRFLSEIARGLGKQPPSVRLKPWWLSLAGLAGLRGAAKTAMSRDVYDNSKITRALGFAFTPIDRAIIEICKTHALVQIAT